MKKAKVNLKESFAPDKSLCLLCAWIFTKAASLHSYITAFDAPHDSLAYITSPLFQIGSSIGILATCAIVLLLAFGGNLPHFSLPIFASTSILIAFHIASILGAYDFLSNESVFFLAGSIWGICTNVISLSLIELLAEEKSSATIALYLAMGSLAAAAISSTLQSASPLCAAIVCISFLICAEKLICFCRKDPRKGEIDSSGCNPLKDTAEEFPKNDLFVSLKETFPILLAFFVSEAIVGMINMFAYASGGALSVSTVLPISGMTICAMVFLGVISMTSGTPASSTLFSFVVPAVMAIILLLPFVGETQGPALSTILSSAYHFVAITTVYCYIKSCEKHGIPVCAFAAIVCGAERIVLLLGLGVGFFLGRSVDGDFFMRATALAVISAYSLGLVILSFGLTSKRRNAEGDSLEDGMISKFKTPESENANKSNVAEMDIASAIASKYDLTNRETDVLKLLARGRDVAFIGETLHLSRNTIQGYVKALYSKLDVHSRRELHDLLDSSESDVPRIC